MGGVSQRIEIKDITLKKAWMFIRSKFRKVKGGVTIKEEDVIHFSEIIMYRALSCPNCVRDGRCMKPEGCGCPVGGLFSAMEAECGRKEEFGGPSWHPLNKKNWVEDWKRYKKENKVMFYKIYN